MTGALRCSSRGTHIVRDRSALPASSPARRRSPVCAVLRLRRLASISLADRRSTVPVRCGVRRVAASVTRGIPKRSRSSGPWRLGFGRASRLSDARTALRVTAGAGANEPRSTRVQDFGDHDEREHTVENIGDVWGLAADKWDEVVSHVGDDDWAKPTPCDGWTVRDLVDHAMRWQGRGGGVFGADVGPNADWAVLRPAIAKALANPANLEGNAEELGGTPKQAVAGLITADLLVHSWDLARSIGADATLPEAAVESTLMGLQRLPEQMLRSDRMFGPAVEVAEDATPQDKLIAFVGRNP